MRQNLQRILVRGGVLSPSELKQIVELAELAGIDALMFGSRQDILLPSRLPNYQPNLIFNEISSAETHSDQ